MLISSFLLKNREKKRAYVAKGTKTADYYTCAVVVVDGVKNNKHTPHRVGPSILTPPSPSSSRRRPRGDVGRKPPKKNNFGSSLLLLLHHRRLQSERDKRRNQAFPTL